MHITLDSQVDKIQKQIKKDSSPILIEGGAGTGKTTLLRALNKKYPNALIVAPTGLAASAIGGFTLHNAFRIKPECPALSPEKLSQKQIDILTSCKIIIVDEISMVRADVLDAANSCMRLACENNSLFGGKPILFFGDLYQLPPVVKEEDYSTFNGMGYNTPWFWGAYCLQGTKIQRLSLTKNWRQEGDPAFIEILNRIRTASHRDTDLSQLNSRVLTHPRDRNRDIPFLATINKTVDQINREAFAKVQGKDLGTLTAILSGKGLSPEEAKKNFIAPVELRLKTNAKYMILCNGLCGLFPYYNGMICTLLGVGDYEMEENNSLQVLPDGWSVPISLSPKTWEIKKIKNNKAYEWRLTQFPLKLAYAITIHKSQGMTLPSAVVDFSSGTFVEGQAYVGLSRLASMDRLSLISPLESHDIKASEEVTSFLSATPTIQLD